MYEGKGEVIIVSGQLNIKEYLHSITCHFEQAKMPLFIGKIPVNCRDDAFTIISSGPVVSSSTITLLISL